MIANGTPRFFYARSLTQTGLIPRLSLRATNEWIPRYSRNYYDVRWRAGDTAECINFAGYLQTWIHKDDAVCAMHLSPLAGLTHSGVRAFLSRHILARVLTCTYARIGKINGSCVARSANRGARWLARGKERETEKNERVLLKSLERRHVELAIIRFGIIYRRGVTWKSQSSDNDIYIFFFSFCFKSGIAAYTFCNDLIITDLSPA